MIAYGLGNLRYFPCVLGRPVTAHPFTQAPTTVPSPAAGLSMIESHGDMVEKHQSMIARRTMDLFPAQPSQCDEAYPCKKPILFTKNMFIAYASIVADYIVRPEGEESNPK